MISPLDDFYLYLKNRGIIIPTDAYEIISKLTYEEIIEVALQCYSLTEKSPSVPKYGLFNFTVNGSISGGIYPCGDLTCRLNRADDFSVFAALYADTVFIPNFFEHIYHLFQKDFEFKNEEQFVHFVSKIVGDITLMLHLKPLFDADILRINPQLATYCQDCLEKKRKEEKILQKQINRIENNVFPEIMRKVEFFFDKTNAIVAIDPEDYLHSAVIRFIEVPPEFWPYIKRAPYKFTSREVKKLGLLEPHFDAIFTDLIAQKFSMKNLNLTYLTDRKIETEIIDRFTGTKHPPDQSRALIEGMSHDLPFIKNVSLVSLIDLRKNQPEAFSVYRDSVYAALREVENETSVNKVKDIAAEIIAPSINKIELLMKRHREKFITSAGGKVLLNSIVLSAGFFADKIGALDINTVIGALGLYDVRSFGKDIINRSRIPDSVSNSNYYFLWKVKRLQSNF